MRQASRAGRAGAGKWWGRVLGFDTDPEDQAPAGEELPAHLGGTSPSRSHKSRRSKRRATFASRGCDAVLICVPTPPSRTARTPVRPSRTCRTCWTPRRRSRDLIERQARPSARHQLVVLESTTYPGTTREVLPILRGRRPGGEVGFLPRLQPGREDPGRRTSRPRSSRNSSAGGCAGRFGGARRGRPRDPAGRTRLCARRAGLERRVAGAAKILENTFRAVNIAAGERTQDAARPRHGHRRVGRLSPPRAPSRSASCRSTPARAWAGTASRSTRSTCPGGRANSACRRASSNSRAR